MTLFLLLMIATEIPVHGTYALDKAGFRDITIQRMEKELGSELNPSQLELVDRELEKLVVTLTLEENGRASFEIDVGDGLPQKGLGRWTLTGTDLELIVTHMFGLRLEEKRLLKGRYLNYTIFMELAEGLPMLSLKKLPTANAEP